MPQGFREEEQLIINFIFVLSPPLLATKRIISTAGPNCTSAAPVSGHFSSPPIQPLRRSTTLLLCFFIFRRNIPAVFPPERTTRRRQAQSSDVSSYRNARDDIRRLAFHSTSAADDADDSHEQDDEYFPFIAHRWLQPINHITRPKYPKSSFTLSCSLASSYSGNHLLAGIFAHGGYFGS